MMIDAKEGHAHAHPLVIDDDVLSAAREMAAPENKSIGEVNSSLARRALSPAETKAKTRDPQE